MKLQINGNEYGLQWGMGAVEMYCDAMDCDVDGLDMIITTGSRHQSKAITTIILCALKNYAELYNSPFDISYRQLSVWLDESPRSEFKAIMDDFKSSKYMGKTVAEYMFGETAPVAEAKKKSRSAKSLTSATR